MNQEMALELDETDRDILGELNLGRATPAYLASRLSPTRQTIQNRLKTLVAAEYVNRPSTGLYELGNKGRKELGVLDGSDIENEEQLREQLERAHEKIEKLESDSAAENCHQAVLGARSHLEDAQGAMDVSDGQTARRCVDGALRVLNEVDV